MPCMWEYLHFTIPLFTPHHPPGLSYQELQLLQGNCQHRLFSYQMIWIALFNFSHSPCWNLLEPTFYKRFFSITLWGCLKSCLAYWPWGRRRQSLNLICVVTCFKAISPNFTEIVLRDPSVQNCCLKQSKVGMILFSYRLAPKHDF